MTTRILKRVRRDEKGTFVVLMSLGLLGVFGFAALSVDIAHVYQQKRDMQSATDFASLAGVALLTNAAATKAEIIQAAEDIALSNGVTLAEITAADTNGVQVGTWNTNNTPPFAANTPASTWNAVLVPAKRTVGLFFGRVAGPGIGLSAMSPAVHSVALLTGAGSAFGGNGAGLIPYAVTPTQAAHPYYQAYSFTKGDIGAGNFGKLDLSSIDNSMSWETAMTDGCGCTLNLNDFYGDITGDDQIYDGFTARFNSNPYVVMAVFSPGNGNSNHGDVITGFITAEIISVTGNKGNWTVNLENVPASFGGGFGGSGGGTTNAPYSVTRVLVQ